MSKAEHQVMIGAPIERVFGVIVDYERYPEFLPELRSVTLESRHDGVAHVRFEVELIVRVAYTLRLVEDPPSQVGWSLAEGKMIAHNNGRWRLDVTAEGTRASYALDVELAGRIPRSVSTRLLGTDLPRMLQRFKDRAEGPSALGQPAKTGAAQST
jgi:coenzyme Q-binding protein COQ10